MTFSGSRVRLYAFLFMACLATVIVPSHSEPLIRAKNPDHPIVSMSPDRKFVATISCDAGECGILNVYRYGPKFRKNLTVVQDVAYTSGFVWVPKHSHSLIFATCGMVGKAGISRFDGSARLTTVVKAVHPDRDCFQLYGASHDGKRIVYGYARDYVPQYTNHDSDIADKKLRKRHTITLAN